MFRLFRRLPYVILGVALLMGAGQPQEKRKDAQSSYEPRSGPGAGQKYLEKFVGNWDVEMTFFSRTGEPTKAKGRCRQTMIHDGRFLQSEFIFEQDGKKATGLGLVGFHPETGQFTTVWTDSRSTRMSLRQSQGPFDGKEIALLSRLIETETRPSRSSRTVSRIEADGNRIVHRQYTAGPDGQERLII